MYIPHPNAVDDPAAVDRMIDEVGAAELITVGADGFPLSTLLPVVRDCSRLLLHMARANPHWRSIPDGAPALAVVAGPQAYVSPSWYASKAEHGKVVPTWNYTAVHLTGRVTVRDDPDWLRGAVTRLTDLHETSRERPWRVTDAPATYIDGMLRAIVGIEMVVERIEAKAKLSQNRSEADRRGVATGLAAEPDDRSRAIARLM